MAFGSIFKRLLRSGKVSKKTALLEMITKNNAQKEADAKAAAEAEQAAKVLANASAITSNGRQTATVNNNTTGTPATSETVADGLLEYVGDVRGRASRRKRGAPMANNQGTLGQPTILGV